jgi:hypothetical protein
MISQKKDGAAVSRRIDQSHIAVLWHQNSQSQLRGGEKERERERERVCLLGGLKLLCNLWCALAKSFLPLGVPWAYSGLLLVSRCIKRILCPVQPN